MTAGLRSLLTLLVGVAVGWGVASIAGADEDPRSEVLRDLAERRLEGMDLSASAGGTTAQEMAMAQFYRLHEFRRLGDEGRAVAWVIPVPAGGEEDPIVAAAGRAGGSVRVPRLAIDPSQRDTWSGEVVRLGSLEGAVDERVFGAFEEIRAFTEAHRWPIGPSFAAVRASEWSDQTIVEEWLSLNRTLVSRVDAILAGL